MNAYLIRDPYPSHVFGTLVFDTGDMFAVLERPWLNNRQNQSCIPAEQYKANFLARSGSGKYRNVWHLVPVKNRTGVLMHNGNLVRHSLGCLIIGSRRGVLGGLPAVFGSRVAMRKINEITDSGDFVLTIIGDQRYELAV
ncbi:MAG: hypothetical protein ACI9GW_001981 [Halieaceae bacterium]|jgi:hypothetical protein